jgi:hypothetical protein
MKYFLALLLVINNCLSAKGQGTEAPFQFPDQYNFVQLYQLDSLGKSNSIAKYFGKQYFTFLQLIEKQLEPADSLTKEQVRHFEKNFAQFFIDACEAYCQHQSILIPEWRAYFSDSSLQPIQYKLLAANAHLNGGLFRALVQSYTQEEMNELKNEFDIFKKSLNTTYKLLYREAAAENRTIKKFDRITFGILRWAGNYYLYRWRRRQMKLARFFWTESSRYPALLKKIEKKKKKIDWLISHTL